MSIERVLAVETSCDDTSVAIVNSDGFVVQQVSANQDLEHEAFGGVVPEVASRNHSKNLIPLIEKCLAHAGLGLKDMDGLVVTSRPGLVGSLIVGVVTMKSLALKSKLPILGVNHLEGHIFAPFLQDAAHRPAVGLRYPFVALAVSGGHTSLYQVSGLGQYRILGGSVDDAAGEAYDKFAKMLGLGFPGGVQVDRLAAAGDPSAFQFPRPMLKEPGCKMSFSGIKASAERLLQKLSAEEIETSLADLCASFQAAVVEVLIQKTKEALKIAPTDLVAITGGVSANSELRKQAQAMAQNEGVCIVIPPLRYCTDNAAMIAWPGLLRLQRGEVSPPNFGPSPRSHPGDFL